VYLQEIIISLIPLAAIFGGLAIVALGIHHRYKVREFLHRERLAMIEKGLTPPPEVDPDAFEASLARQAQSGSARADRQRTSGIVLIAVGLGLMLLIGVAGGETDAAIGVGGAIVLLGIALVVNSSLTARGHQRSDPVNRRREPTLPDLPPSNG
jgi:hypothetical protein